MKCSTSRLREIKTRGVVFVIYKNSIMKLFYITVNLCNIFPQKCNIISSLFFILLVIRQNRISAVHPDNNH